MSLKELYQPPNYDPKVDQWDLAHDFYLAPSAQEIQTLTSGTLTNFTASLVAGTAYTLAAIGTGTAWVTLNSGSPSLIAGTGSNSGVPVVGGSTIPFFIARSGSTLLKATTGDTGITLVLYLAASAGI